MKTKKGNWAATLGSLLVAILAARAGSADGAAASVIGTQAALAQNYLSFSRDAEREADRVGFNSLVRAGFDPKGMETSLNAWTSITALMKARAPHRLTCARTR